MIITHQVDPEDILCTVQQEVESAGMTLKEFKELGREGTLRDANLRELWLLFKHVLY